MVPQREIKSLLNYKSKENSALTIYLQTSPGLLNLRSTKTTYKNLIKRLNDEQKKLLHKQINAISTLLHTSPPTSRGVAIFASPSKFITYSLPTAPYQNMIEVSNHWVVHPLAYIKQFYPIVLLTVIHEKDVSLYSIGKDIKRLLTIKQKKEKREDRLGFFGRAGVTKGRGGGTADKVSKPLQRLHTFLKDTATKIQKRIEAEKRKLDNEAITVVVGEGNALKYYTQDLQTSIPIRVSLVQKIIGWEREDWLREIGRKVVREWVQKKIKSITSSIIPGEEKRGAVGVSDVLTALQEGRVLTLIISLSNAIPGSICEECNYLSATKLDTCPICNAKVVQKDDMKEEIYRKGLKMANEVILTKQPLPNKTQLIATFRY